MFSTSDERKLAAAGIALESAIDTGRQSYSATIPERLLQAAAGARLLGDELRSTPTLVVRLDGRELTQPEYRALTDLLCSDHLVWIGPRLAVTASARELLNR